MFRHLLLMLMLMLGLAGQDPGDWHQAFPPFRIAGNLYYVGTGGLASYLITTPEGHILINASYERDVPLIRAAVEKLGFQFRDVKILLTSHAHADHAAGTPLVKELTAAKVMVMAGDDVVVRKGEPGWKPCPVDRVLKDGDVVKLGSAVLTAHLTPGHTKGATTWTFPVTEGANTYSVLIVSSLTINHPQGLAHNRAYPEIVQDYERAYRTLHGLRCDIFLAPHGEQFGMRAKVARMKDGANPFVNPAEFGRYLGDQEKIFRARLAAGN